MTEKDVCYMCHRTLDEYNEYRGSHMLGKTEPGLLKCFEIHTLDGMEYRLCPVCDEFFKALKAGLRSVPRLRCSESLGADLRHRPAHAGQQPRGGICVEDDVRWLQDL